MEGGRARTVLVAGLVLGLLVGQSTAAFPFCYGKCFTVCLVKSFGHGNCAAECMPKCISKSVGGQSDTHHFCKLGCAMKSCTHISTEQDPGVAKVEGCVDSCSGMCTKNYMSP